MLEENNYLVGNTATLPLSNCSSLTILINESGDGLQYQFNFGSEKVQPIEEAEIIYRQDEDNEDLQPAFDINGNIYFINNFMKDKR